MVPGGYLHPQGQTEPGALAWVGHDGGHEGVTFLYILTKDTLKPTLPFLTGFPCSCPCAHPCSIDQCLFTLCSAGPILRRHCVSTRTVPAHSLHLDIPCAKMCADVQEWLPGLTAGCAHRERRAQ